MKWLLVLILAVASAAPACAAVYEWTDDRGVVNFTDNADNIPDKYRKSARVKDLSRQPNVMVIGETSGPQASPGGVTPDKEAYGGHSAGWWRSSLANSEREVKALEQRLAEKRQRLARLHRKRVVFQKPGDRVELNELKKEVEADEARLRDLQAKLDQLRSEAAHAGVPEGK